MSFAALRLLICGLLLVGSLPVVGHSAPARKLGKTAEIGEQPTAGESRQKRSTYKVAQQDEKAAPADAEAPFKRRIKAPALDGGVEWINTAGPIDLAKLRGKFVVLDFWTYCCINCMHILPNLKKLEHAYPNEIVVIGVHSAKFEGEQDSKNIREAVERHEIEHPVVNDAKHVIWDKFEVQSWPTLCVIDPEGNLVARNSGEIDFETLDKFFKQIMPYYKQKGLIKPSPPPPTGEAAGKKAPATPLRYPGKLLADEKSDRLFISDSNHNRIVVARLDGTLVETIGTGQIGADDGSYDKATFDHPQGMALAGDTLYVADTENHLLRKVDLKKKQVQTIAGTGKQGHEWPGTEELGDVTTRKGKHRYVGPPLKTALNSPWALVVHKNELFIAMAGSHQIWRMSLTKPEIGPYAGNGREDIVDGALLPGMRYDLGFASFAQPSGLSADANFLYVADSEGSSIRAVPFKAGAEVETVVGTAWMPGGRLFAFGDVDGQGQKVRLQHALDVLVHDGLLYVADTYNNKIKKIDPKQATSQTIVGAVTPGATDDPPRFDEPAGLAYAAGKLYVADTNNHLIRTVDLKRNDAVATLSIQGLEPPAEPKATTKPSFADADKVELKAARIKPVDGKVKLHVALALPDGYKINPLASMRYLVESSDSTGPLNRAELGKLTSSDSKNPTFDIELPVESAGGTEKLSISLGYYYCQEGSEGVCKTGSVTWTLPLTVAADAASTSVNLPYTVP